MIVLCPSCHARYSFRGNGEAATSHSACCGQCHGEVPLTEARRSYVLTPARPIPGRSSVPGRPPVGLDHPELAHEIAARSGGQASQRVHVHDAQQEAATMMMPPEPAEVAPPASAASTPEPAAEARVPEPQWTPVGEAYPAPSETETLPEAELPAAAASVDPLPPLDDDVRLSLEPGRGAGAEDDHDMLDDLAEPSWTEIAAAALPLGAGTAAGYHLGAAWGLDALTGAAIGGAAGLLTGWVCYAWFARRSS